MLPPLTAISLWYAAVYFSFQIVFMNRPMPTMCAKSVIFALLLIFKQMTDSMCCHWKFRSFPLVADCGQLTHLFLELDWIKTLCSAAFSCALATFFAWHFTEPPTFFLVIAFVLSSGLAVYKQVSNSLLLTKPGIPAQSLIGEILNCYVKSYNLRKLVILPLIGMVIGRIVMGYVQTYCVLIWFYGLLFVDLPTSELTCKFKARCYFKVTPDDAAQMIMAKEPEMQLIGLHFLNVDIMRRGINKLEA